MKSVCYSLLIFLVISGCDIPGTFKIKNGTNANIDIRVCLLYESRNDCLSKMISINSGEFGYLSFGFGTRWTDMTIERIVENVDTVHLTVEKRKYYCATEECKKDIFNRLNQKSKRKLEVTIDSTFIEKVFMEK